MPTTEPKPDPHRVELTPALIASLPPVEKRHRGPYDDKVPALFLMRQAPSRKYPEGKRDYYVAYRSPVTGKAVEYRIGPATLAPSTARKRAKTVLGKVAEEKDPQAEKVAERREKEAERKGTGTLRVYFEEHYVPDVLRNKRSGDATAERIQNVWAPLFGKKLHQITQLDVRRIRRERLEKVTPQTWNRDLGALRACLNHAVKGGYLPESPIKPEDAAEEVDENRVRYLGQRDEVENIQIDGRKVGENERFWLALERAPKYLRVLVTLAMKTGARRGELFALKWGAVSLEQGAIVLEAHTTKSAKKRTVPLPSTAIEVLREWKPKDAKAGDLVVPSPVTGAKIYTLKKAWAALLKDAQISDFRWHDMRHDYASKLVMADVSIFKVSRLLGHKDPQLTADRYAGLAPDAMRKDVEVLA